jgi:hypothetical protein
MLHCRSMILSESANGRTVHGFVSMARQAMQLQTGHLLHTRAGQALVVG